jgi:GT2 family glycosyltransferase
VGAVTFSLDPRLVNALSSVLPFGTLVETGTFKGDTVAELESYFDKVVSIELSAALWADAVKRFEAYPHVQILRGNSQDRLRALQSELQNVGALYWLDAHWCVATGTAGELSQCPLLNELQAIGKLNSESVVLIDDARLFLAPPLAPHEISHWPSFDQIVARLSSLSTEHELMVVNDVIAFFPRKAKAAMKSYAQLYGMDWLVAANFLKQNGTFMQQLVEKESAIQGFNTVIQQLNNIIHDKELVIQQQKRTIAYGSIFLLPTIARVIRRTREIIWPRIGNLNQYNPRPLSVSSLEKSKPVLGTWPKISIVTPSFGQGAYIEKTLSSVLDQQYPNLEYFVQDGGSKDNTVAVLKKYEDKLSGWASEKDSGQSQAINLGFTNTSGEIMGWLNSDDLLLPDALTIVADYFNRHPEVDVVYGNRLLIDENDMEIGRWIMPGHDSGVLSWVDYVPQETMFWRRRIWDKVGGHIDQSFRFAMDWDLLVRFRGAGAKFAHIPRFLGAFRIHEHQKTSAVINEIGRQEMDRMRERLLGRVPTRKEIRRKILPFLLKHVAVDMVYRIKTRLASKQ